MSTSSCTSSLPFVQAVTGNSSQRDNASFWAGKDSCMLLLMQRSPCFLGSHTALVAQVHLHQAVALFKLGLHEFGRHPVAPRLHTQGSNKASSPRQAAANVRAPAEPAARCEKAAAAEELGEAAACTACPHRTTQPARRPGPGPASRSASAPVARHGPPPPPPPHPCLLGAVEQQGGDDRHCPLLLLPCGAGLVALLLGHLPGAHHKVGEGLVKGGAGRVSAVPWARPAPL